MPINGNFLKRLVKEDFDQQYQPLVDKIAFVLNPAIEQILRLFAHGLNVSDLNVQVKQITVKVNSTGNPITTAVFKSSLNGRCTMMQVGRAVNLTNPQVYPTGGHSVSFTLDNDNVVIKNITGLTPDDNWQLTLIAYV